MYSNDVVRLRPSRARALARALREEAGDLSRHAEVARRLLADHGLDATAVRPAGEVVAGLERWGKEVDTAVDRVLGLTAEPRCGVPVTTARRAARQVLALLRHGARRERATAARLLAQHARDRTFAHALFAGLPARALAVQVGLLAELRRAGAAGAERSVQERVVAGLRTALATHLADHGHVDVHEWVTAAGGTTPAGALALLLGHGRYPTRFLVDLAHELVVVPNRERLAGRAIAGPDDFRPVVLQAVARDRDAARQVVGPNLGALLPSRLDYADRGTALAAVLEAAMVPADRRIGAAVITWIGNHHDAPPAVVDQLPVLLPPYFAAFRRVTNQSGLVAPVRLHADVIDSILSMAYSTERRARAMEAAATRWVVHGIYDATSRRDSAPLSGIAAVAAVLARADEDAVADRGEDDDHDREVERRLIGMAQSAVSAIPAAGAAMRASQTMTGVFGPVTIDRLLPGTHYQLDALRDRGPRLLGTFLTVIGDLAFFTSMSGWTGELGEPIERYLAGEREPGEPVGTPGDRLAAALADMMARAYMAEADAA